MENLQSDDRTHRLNILAADLAELERRKAHQRIRTAIEEAQRRKLRPGRNDLLKPYQVESALRRLGEGASVLSVSHSRPWGQVRFTISTLAALTNCAVKERTSRKRT